jgi:hypothetical protein
VWVSGVEEDEVRADLLVGVYDPVDEIGPDALAVPHVRRGDHDLAVELVGVELRADERLAVVGLGLPGGQAADFRQDHQAGSLLRWGGPGRGRAEVASRAARTATPTALVEWLMTLPRGCVAGRGVGGLDPGLPADTITRDGP